MTKTKARRALFVVALVLLVLAVVGDLARRDSLLRATWNGVRPHRTETEQMIREFQRNRARPQRPAR